MKRHSVKRAARAGSRSGKAWTTEPTNVQRSKAKRGFSGHADQVVVPTNRQSVNRAPSLSPRVGDHSDPHIVDELAAAEGEVAIDLGALGLDVDARSGSAVNGGAAGEAELAIAKIIAAPADDADSLPAVVPRDQFAQSAAGGTAIVAVDHHAVLAVMVDQQVGDGLAGVVVEQPQARSGDLPAGVAIGTAKEQAARYCRRVRDRGPRWAPGFRRSGSSPGTGWRCRPGDSWAWDDGRARPARYRRSRSAGRAGSAAGRRCRESATGERGCAARGPAPGSSHRDHRRAIARRPCRSCPRPAGSCRRRGGLPPRSTPRRPACRCWRHRRARRNPPGEGRRRLAPGPATTKPPPRWLQGRRVDRSSWPPSLRCNA